MTGPARRIAGVNVTIAETTTRTEGNPARVSGRGRPISVQKWDRTIDNERCGALVSHIALLALDIPTTSRLTGSLDQTAPLRADR
jgi:hypothetical protein